MVSFRIVLYLAVNLFMINTGIVFLLPVFLKTKEDYDRLKDLVFGNVFHVLMGFIGFFLAILKILFPYNGIIVFGDLLPVLVLIIESFVLLLGYIRISKSLDRKWIRKGEALLTGIQLPIGISSIFSALIHILLAPILLL